MIETGIGAEVIEGSAGSRLGVGSAEDQPVDAGGDESPRAHRARFEGDVHRRAVKPPATEDGCGVLQGQNLGVGSGVSAVLSFVVSPGDHTPVTHDDGPDWNVACRPRELGFLESSRHRLLVGHGEHGSAGPEQHLRRILGPHALDGPRRAKPL